MTVPSQAHKRGQLALKQQVLTDQAVTKSLHLAPPLPPVPVHPRKWEISQTSVAAAGSDHHVAVLLQDDVGAVIKVKH